MGTRMDAKCTDIKNIKVEVKSLYKWGKENCVCISIINLFIKENKY